MLKLFLYWWKIGKLLFLLLPWSISFYSSNSFFNMLTTKLFIYYYIFLFYFSRFENFYHCWIYLLFNRNQLLQSFTAKGILLNCILKNHRYNNITWYLHKNGHPSKFEPWQSKLNFNDQIRINCTCIAKIINSKFSL